MTLASTAAFNATAYANLAADLPPEQLTEVMLRASRACESACRRRLMPFTLTESHRLVDSDVEDAITLTMAMPNQAQINLDYARALGFPQLVRHFWVLESPPLYPDMWTGHITAISIRWSYALDPLTVNPATVQFEPDTGHARFALGTFVPPGSTGLVTYTGGYSLIPEDLVEAAIMKAAVILLRRLDPAMRGNMAPGDLNGEADELLAPYTRTS